MLGDVLGGLTITDLILIVFVAAVGFPVFGALAMPLGILWAPFAAVLCSLRARSIGQSPWRYAAIGALYSSLLLLPWVYLVTISKRW